ncbi:hypothetical protein [Ascidiimonas sp. W6]|uniref:hypothetical protein n=1 Tax=Ascidiimonas meishanensis TaxID=3128903 RepID=UPI0030EE3A5B
MKKLIIGVCLVIGMLFISYVSEYSEMENFKVQSKLLDLKKDKADTVKSSKIVSSEASVFCLKLCSLKILK